MRQISSGGGWRRWGWLGLSLVLADWDTPAAGFGGRLGGGACDKDVHPAGTFFPAAPVAGWGEVAVMP